MFDKKTYKEMKCPICRKFYFTELEDKVEIEGEIPFGLAYVLAKQKESKVEEKPQCYHCGWKYDLEQLENPELTTGENELSFNGYKKWYKEKIKENPKWDYMEERYPKVLHKCPVCGEYEFPYEDSHDICPVCGWEDDSLMEKEPNDWGGASNDLCLNDYRKEFSKIRQKNPEYRWDKLSDKK